MLGLPALKIQGYGVVSIRVQRCAITPLTVDLKKTKCSSNLIYSEAISFTGSKTTPYGPLRWVLPFGRRLLGLLYL